MGSFANLTKVTIAKDKHCHVISRFANLTKATIAKGSMQV